jgi:colanic acid/amylovoran biosynthesis glycosyltransferase
MKILICSNAFEHITNGPAKFVNLILKINELYPDHEVRILTEDIIDDRNFVFPLKLTIPSLFKPFGQVIRMFLYHKEAMRIRKEEFEFDVLVYNNAFIGLWSALHFPQTVGMINDYSNAYANFYNVLMRQSPFKRFIFKQFEKLSVVFLRRIITNSDYLTRELQLIYSIPPYKISRLYKAIEAPIKYKNTTMLNHPVNILFVKTDYQTGGLMDLFEALTNVNFEYHLFVVGPGQAHYLTLEKKIRDLGIHCTLCGRKSSSDVSLLMMDSDIFCVPSHKEALGVANIEAMARGLAVVSSNAGGIPEVLDYGNNGWIVPVANPNALSKALNECVFNEEMRKEKIRHAMSFAQRFSERQMFQNFTDIISSVRHG